MIDFEIAQRLVRMQERLRAATYHEIKKDGNHKSSEGAVSLAFNLPSVFSDERAPGWSVTVYSYVLGPNRSHEFFGASALEAISKAEDAVGEWCFASEIEMMFGPQDVDGDE